jgi:hypothetical protein
MEDLTAKNMSIISDIDVEQLQGVPMTSLVTGESQKLL